MFLLSYRNLKCKKKNTSYLDSEKIYKKYNRFCLSIYEFILKNTNYVNFISHKLTLN